MLNAILSAAALRRVVTEVPDQRLLPHGGPWGQRVPDVPAMHDELVEYDRNIPPAADILATGAESRDVAERPTEIVMHRAMRLKSSSRLTASDLQTLMRVVQSNGALAADRQALLGIARRHTERRLQSLRITRGILLAGMACGDLSWSFGGVQTGTIDFGMPAALKATPGQYWRLNNGSINVNATPLTNMVALDRQAEQLGGSKFDWVDMTQSLYDAMLGTTEYQNQAKAVSAVYNVASLPVAGTDSARALAERVIGKRINITDATYEWEDDAGTRFTGRYMPEKYIVLSRESEHGSGVAYDFANVPVTESAVAAIAGDPTFTADSEVVRGPVPYITHDRNGFAWVRMHATQEGTPRRHLRTATARILGVQP